MIRLATEDKIKTLPLNDWDIAYAIRLSAINAVITARASSPRTMSYDYRDPLPAPPAVPDDCFHYHLDCTFGDWQLDGGTGPLVYLTIPITEPKLLTEELGPDASPAKTVTYVPLKARVLCRLKWRRSATDTRLEELVIDVPAKFRNSANGAPAGLGDDIESVTVLSLSLMNDSPDPSGTRVVPKETRLNVLKGLVQSMLREHIHQFDQVFASIDYTRQVKSDKMQWLQPTSHNYSVQTAEVEPSKLTKGEKSVGKTGKLADAKPTESILVILCMTEGRPNPADVNVSAHLIPEGANSAYCFNENLIIPNLIKPGLHHIFAESTSPDVFELQNNGLLLTNSENIEFKKQEIEQRDFYGIFAHTTVTPKTTKGSLKIQISNGRLLYSVAASYVHEADGLMVHQNSVVHYNMQINSTMALEKDPNNSQRQIFAVHVAPGTSVDNYVVPETEVESWGEYIKKQAANFAIQLLIMIAAGSLGGMMQRGIVRAASKSASKTAKQIATGVVDVEKVEVDMAKAGETTEAKEAMANEPKKIAANDAAVTAKGEVLAKQGKLVNFVSGQCGGLILMMLCQTLLGNGEELLSHLATVNFQESGSIPTFDHIVEAGIECIEWPHAEKAGFFVTGGELTNGCFNIGVNLMAKI